ncbi:MAG: hypothetical protein JSS49_03415 [Planctomycetes bacterium]|nr:hypothetical protein [Planctomycetota bacterium]
MRRIRWQSYIQGLVVVVAFSSGAALAGGPFPFTEAWYQQRADDPPGARQIEKHGKYWPPYPRPMGRKQTFSHAYHTAHYWPYPYNCQDRADVNNLLDAQTGAGWALATTLHDYHFDEDTQQLTDAARSQLLWTANSVPPQYRTVYISQGNTPEKGQLRIAQAETYFREMGIQNSPPVVARYETFNGRPANEVDVVRRLELESIPKPRLFLIGRQASGGGGGAGGSSAASAAGGSSVQSGNGGSSGR